MKTSQKTLSLVLGSAFAASIAAGTVHAAENPFFAKPLTSGYMLAEADKMPNGKCGTGKCSAERKKHMEEQAAAGGDKAKEGSCSADKDKSKEGSCSADKEKGKEGSCHADKK